MENNRSSRGNGLLPLWRCAGYAARPALRLMLAVRTANGKEDPARRGERFGRPSAPHPPGPMVWVHAASVGEITAALPLIGALTALGLQVLATTGTVTSARVAAERLPPGAVHQFVPLDVAPYLRRFLDFWRPSLALFVESEVWPTTIDELARRGIARIIVNGRMSERSHRGWKRWPAVAHALFGRLTACLAQSGGDAERFRDLGVDDVHVSGNLKFDVAPLPVDAGKLTDLRRALAGRPCWVAASTHAGEEDMVAVAHARLAAHWPDLVTFVVPRHPERGGAIAERLDPSGAGQSVALRSRGQPLSAATRFYVADTIGELGLFYSLAPVAFVGGSLVHVGGHNPIEPVQLGAAVVTGPHVANFRSIYADLGRAGGVVAVDNADRLAQAVDGLLGDAAAAREIVTRARSVLDQHVGSVARTLTVLQPLLPLPAIGAGA